MPELQGNHESDPSEIPIKRILVCELFFRPGPLCQEDWEHRGDLGNQRQGRQYLC